MKKTRTALDQLKIKNDRKDISEIMQELDTVQSASLEQRKEFICLLYYLDRTARFKEDPQYKNVSFKMFLNSRYHLRTGTYENEKIAFLCHEQQTLKYGVGLVIKIRRECGPTKVDLVFSKISTRNTLQEINDVINLYAKPKKVITPKINIPTAIEQTLRQQVLELTKMLEEKDVQIGKLKTKYTELQQKYDQVSVLYTAIDPIMTQIQKQGVSLSI